MWEKVGHGGKIHRRRTSRRPATTVEVAAQPGPDRAGKLDRKVVMVGDLTRFELWDEQIWEAYLDKQAAAGLPEDLGDIPGL